MDKAAWLAALGLPSRRGPGALLPERMAPHAGFAQAHADVPSPNGMLANGPFPLPAGAAVEHDLAYGGHPAHKLDVYRPATAEGAGLTAIIFMVHGGGWARGDKGLWRSVRNKVLHWVRQGYVLASVNYRLIPAARPIEQARDVATALAFVQVNAHRWCADPSRVVLMGHSSGAHLVSLISTDPSIAVGAGAKPWLGTIALDSAAFDVVAMMSNRHFGLYDRAFGHDAEYWRDASPFHRMSATLSAPFLAVCSTQRGDSCIQAEAFVAKAVGLGGTASLMPVDFSHGDVNDLLGTACAYTQGVDAFLASLGLP